ncbi:MAG: magnesium/cobalt transporter CorA [Gammaproteobacteria bacterium]
MKPRKKRSRLKRKVHARVASLRKHRVRIHYHRPGAPPGSLESAVVEETAAPPARISLLRYAKKGVIEERREVAPAELKAPAADAAEVEWIHVQGLPTPEQLKALGETFGLHPLALEDVFNREGRAKFESYEAHQFVVLSHVHRDEGGGFSADQVSFFLGKRYLISINEGAKDVFDPVRQRIRSNGKVCGRDAGYLLYTLMDVVIDEGFPLLEALGDDLEALEDEILDNPSREARNKIHYAKRELVQMRRAWWPQREVIASLMRDGEQFLSETTRLYMRDCYDHCVIVMDFVETYREMTSSLLDTYLSSVSQRMNDIMKSLTMIATIFLPLSFIAGLYGMNFTASPWNMPELHWHYGYFYALGVMIAIMLGMIFYFRRKRWL